jgi:hypothetical protein
MVNEGIVGAGLETLPYQSSYFKPFSIVYPKAFGVGGPTPAQKGKRGWVMTNRYPHPQSRSQGEGLLPPFSMLEKGPGVEVRKAVLDSLPKRSEFYEA